MAFVLKKLATRSSSLVVPYLRRPPNHPRHFIAEVRSILKELSPRNMLFGCPSSFASSFTRRVLYATPHTLRVTSRVTGEEARGLGGGDEDVTLGTSMKFSLHIPGIEKITDTPENLYIFIDMGLHKNWECDDLDVNEFRAILCDDVGLNNIMLVEGYVQKLDIRRNYTAFVCLPPNIKANSTDFVVMAENGGVVLTIPKLVPASRSFLGLMRKNVEDEQFTSVDFISVNPVGEMHGHLRLAVQDRDKNFKVFLYGRILTIFGDDGKAINSLTIVPTSSFKSSEVLAIRGCGDIRVIFPFTREKVEHDPRIKVEVPFV